MKSSFNRSLTPCERTALKYLEGFLFESGEFSSGKIAFVVNQLSALVNSDLLCINEQKNAINQWERKTFSLCDGAGDETNMEIYKFKWIIASYCIKFFHDYWLYGNFDAYGSFTRIAQQWLLNLESLGDSKRKWKHDVEQRDH